MNRNISALLLHNTYVFKSWQNYIMPSHFPKRHWELAISLYLIDTHPPIFQQSFNINPFKKFKSVWLGSFYLIIDVFYGRPQSNKSASFDCFGLILAEMARNCKIVCFSIRQNKSRLLFVSILQYTKQR